MCPPVLCLGPSLQLSLLHTLPLAQVLLPPSAPSSLASLLATGLLGMCRLITRPSRSDLELLEVEAPYTARVVGALATNNNLQQPIVRGETTVPPSLYTTHLHSTHIGLHFS